MIAWSYLVPGRKVPKVGTTQGPHSPFRAPTVRSQFGTKSPLLSVHCRCVCVIIVDAGLFARAYRIESCSTPRLALAFSAVLPLPNRSYVPEIRGLMSFQLGTFLTSSKLKLRLGAHLWGPAVNGSVDSFRKSRRMPPFNDRRFTVHRSCAKMPRL